jgi:hypothetical protein
VSRDAGGAAALRNRTRAHYDRYPFRFDQRAILREKLERCVMGEAIRDLPDAERVILDVGCGATASPTRCGRREGAASSESASRVARCTMQRATTPTRSWVATTPRSRSGATRPTS